VRCGGRQPFGRFLARMSSGATARFSAMDSESSRKAVRECEIEQGARRLQAARVRLKRGMEPRAVDAPPKTKAATVIGSIAAQQPR